MRTRTVCLLVVALAGTPTWLVGQDPDAAEVREALTMLREASMGHQVTALLTQERRARSPTALDAIADSLVGIATAYRSGDSRASQLAAVSARVALIMAAKAERGTPYPGAFDALVRIFHGSMEPGTKSGTLFAMTYLPELGPVIEFLAEVAQSQERGPAVAAVGHLARNTGREGLAVLEHLFRADAVVDPVAREHLDVLANYYGWAR